MNTYLMAPVCYTKLHHALTEACDDNFHMRLYTSKPKMSVYQSAIGMTPFFCDS